MTDLVERLRTASDEIRTHGAIPKGHLMSEAADEIERLRAQGDVLFASIKSNADEIERLRAALKKIAAIKYDHQEMNDIAFAAIKDVP